MPPQTSETLTPDSTPPIPPPPDKPPDPSLSALFPERTPYRDTENPFQLKVSKETTEEQKCILSEVLEDLRHPFSYDTEGPLSFDG